MFMNRVHGQCPKNLTRENTQSKRIENGPSAPSAQPATSLRAQAARPATPRPRTLSAPAPAAAPRAPACLACPARLPLAHLRAPRPRTPACAPLTPPARAYCAQLPSPEPAQSTVTIQHVYCDTPTHLAALVTTVLQYNCHPTQPIEIQSF